MICAAVLWKLQMPNTVFRFTNYHTVRDRSACQWHFIAFHIFLLCLEQLLHQKFLDVYLFLEHAVLNLSHMKMPSTVNHFLAYLQNHTSYQCISFLSFKASIRNTLPTKLYTYTYTEQSHFTLYLQYCMLLILIHVYIFSQQTQWSILRWRTWMCMHLLANKLG